MTAALAGFEPALERAVTRFDTRSPAAEQLGYHFAFADDVRRGKRLRSRLLLAVAAEEGAPADAALDAAVAVEVIHEFSLIHDDIQDGDRTRRGRETLWARYGLAHAINAGDALCAVAYLALLDPPRRDGERTVAMCRALLDAHLAMCAGQGRDIAFERAARVTMDEYRSMIAGKTGALFGAACELGALAAGAERPRAAAYARFGRALGVAFQIEDDVLGIWGNAVRTGKPNADLAKRKWTFPVVWALAGPRSDAREAIAAAYAPGSALAPEAVAATTAALDSLAAREAGVAAARAARAEADAIAADSGIDAHGRVRALWSTAVRTPA